ncbi:MAG: hypothetical protein WC846_05530 [Candidatus Gracilibacteria bacterium]
MEKNDKQNHWEIQGKTHHFNWTARVNYFAITNRGKRLVQAKKSSLKNPQIHHHLCTCKVVGWIGFARAKDNLVRLSRTCKTNVKSRP